jgi:hypothetical protein
MQYPMPSVLRYKALFSVLFLTLTSCTALLAQVRGRIIDTDGHPLAFVSILSEDGKGRVWISDLEGRFSISGPVPSALVFRYVGFETLRLEGDYLRRHAPELPDIVLKGSDLSLPEAVIRPGVNPAERLIRLAIENRKGNNPEWYPFFTCNTYNKINFDFVPNRAVFNKKIANKDSSKEHIQEQIENFNRIENNSKTQHLFFMESVTERRFLFPSQNQEKVLLNRVSGYQDLGLVAIANAVQPFSFYGDFIRVLDRDFVNPISPGAVSQYFFEMKDTLYQGQDTLWTIAFRPRKGKIFNALSGVLQLHSDRYAIHNIRANTTGTALLNVRMEQAYQRVWVQDSSAQRWFPEQLNFEITIPAYPDKAVGTHISGRSFVSKVDLDARVTTRDFIPEMPIYLLPNASSQPDSSWTKWRQAAPLSAREARTYVFLDSLVKVKKVRWLSALMNYAITGKAPLKYGLSLELQHLLKLNEFEGTRLGLGLSTAESRPLRLPRRVEVGAYGGYGFRDKRWKYGGYGIWRLSRARNTQLRVGWRKDLLEPGALHELNKANFVNRTLYARRMDYLEEWSGSIGSQIGRDVTVQASVARQDIQPAYAYAYGSDGRRGFRFAESTLYVRFARAGQPATFLMDNAKLIQRFPVLELAYTKAWKGVAGGEYDYQRWAMALRQNLYIRRLGRLNWRMEAGLATGDAPLSKLFTLNQSSSNNGGLTLFIAPNTFQSLPDTLFLADRFVNLFVSQEIGPVLYQHPYSAPILILLHNLSWGSIRNAGIHREIGFLTPSPLIAEGGVQLDNLLRVKYLDIAYLGLGGAIFYRWSGPDKGSWVPRISMRFNFG